MAGTSSGHRGCLLIISGPSGVGKTTITHQVEGAIQGSAFSVSATTRPRTPADREGADYFFVSDAQFDQMIERGEFLEHAGVFGKRYGTPRQWVLDRLNEGRLVILEIDVQGAANVKRQMPEALALFVLPPSEPELLARLRARKREGEDVIQRRFQEAKREIDAAITGGFYDVFIVNRDLREAVALAIGVVKAKMALCAG